MVGKNLDEYVSGLFEKVRQADEVTVKLVLRQLYETEFGIFDHISYNKERPLSGVAMFEAENVDSDNALDNVMATYIDKRIKDTFGLSFIEYVSLPRNYIIKMLELCDRETTKKNNALADVEKQLNVT